MKVRSVVLLLALLTFLSASVAGYLYYASLRKAAAQEADRAAEAHLAHLESNLSSVLAENLNTVKVLAGLGELFDALKDPTQDNLYRANQVLDHFHRSTGATVCYLMDAGGMTIASSNRAEPTSFVGWDYSFRPYFQEALDGNPSVYMASGVTSGERGVYYSHHVYGPAGDAPMGVAVIKASVDGFENAFFRHENGVGLLVDPHGVIFACSRRDWLYRTLWPTTPEQAAAIAATRRFGPGPWEWVGLERVNDGLMRGPGDREYLVYQIDIHHFPGWKIFYLLGRDQLAASAPHLAFRMIGVIVLVFCFLIGFAVFLLYRNASYDIRRRRAMEAALRESEERFRSIVENSHDGIVIIGGNYRIDYANSQAGRILDIPSDDLIGRDFRELVAESSRDEVVENYLKRQRGESVPPRYEFQVVRKDGSLRLVETSTSVFQDSKGVSRSVAQLLDITERRAIEEVRKESEEKYRTILESIGEGYFEVDLSGRLTFFNDSFCRVMGHPRDVMSDAALGEFMPADAAEGVLASFNGLSASGGPAKVRDYDVLTAEGEKRSVEMSASPRLDPTGRTIGYRGVIRDVTDRRRSEEALRESEERYRTVLEANPDPVVVYDMEGRVIYFNPAFTQVFGFSLEEARGKKMDHFVPPQAWSETTVMIQKVLNRESFSGVETLRYNKAGELIPVSLSGACYTDDEGNLLGSVINLRDIRRQKDLESQLQQALKMEAVGTLASGIAHDFNNLLQAISGYVQLMVSKGGQTPESLRYLGEVDQTVLRGGELVQRLLTFSRKVKTELRSVDLNREIVQTVAVLERTIPKMIRIETRLSDDLKPIEGDPGQLEQVLMNLGVNAKDAMPDGGRLTVSTWNVTLDEDFCRRHLELKPGDYVLLSVADTGHGMDEETARHIFEPFFTTKAVGQGTGLGLSSIYGIVQSHGGHIICSSAPGQGTTFDIYLPVLDASSSSIEVESSGEEAVRGGEETILVVDDEPAVREVAREYLESYGYTVIEAATGEEALGVYRGRGGADLVILDLGMPGMGGQHCLKELLSFDPNARVLIASGYSSAQSMTQTRESGAKGFIRKPYRLVEMLRRIRQALDTPD